ncbi:MULTISPECIES: hypothetical protein [Eikenella]|uniref:hypothetical protein n=1 Tax=Eikenella TaxID=538 RepID=UPI000B129AE1|nr:MULTISPECIES: hypothetical protein [Eikenella]
MAQRRFQQSQSRRTNFQVAFPAVIYNAHIPAKRQPFPNHAAQAFHLNNERYFSGSLQAGLKAT